MPYRAVLLLLSTPLLAQDFQIRIPPAAREHGVTVLYTLQSHKRLLHGWARSQSSEATLSVPIVFRSGVVADEVNMVFIAPGCEGRSLTRSLLDTTQRSVSFDCALLPKISLDGSILTPKRLQPSIHDFKVVEADFIPEWANTFLGLTSNGPKLRIPMGTAPLRADGTFSISLPDLALDREHRGSIQFWSKDQATGRDFAILRTTIADRFGNLATAAGLPSNVEFYPCMLLHTPQHTTFAVRGAADSCDAP